MAVSRSFETSSLRTDRAPVAQTMAHIVHTTLRSVFLVLVVSIVTTGQEAGEQSCPHFGVNFRGRCFWFVNIATTWNDAGILCHRLYGDHVTLVTIKDEDTNQFVRSQWPVQSWIGLHEAFGETNWRWVDNTEPTNGNYENWRDGRAPPPKPGLSNCALMIARSDLWKDHNCAESAFPVCAELPSEPMCPRGGIFFRDRCYWRGSIRHSWAAANQACQDEFGSETRLAVARDVETNLFLSRLVSANSWLGLSYMENEGVFRWIDGAPLEYQNWANQEPDNSGNCVVIERQGGKWRDIPCGDPMSESDRVTVTAPYICSIPPCYEATDSSGNDLVTVSNQEVRIIDHSVCAKTECSQRCVNGGACNSTGQCICVKQFPAMTCNLDQWEVQIEKELEDVVTGSTLSLKCKFNLPVEYISSLTWNSCEPGYLPQYRHKITKSYSQGYSILEISDVTMADAGQYHCNVLLNLSNTTIPVVRTAVVNVTDTSRPLHTTRPASVRTINNHQSIPLSVMNVTTENIGNKAKSDASKNSEIQQTGGNTAIIVILLVMTVLLLGTVVVLMIKIKKMEVALSEKEGLVEMENSF